MMRILKTFLQLTIGVVIVAGISLISLVAWLQFAPVSLVPLAGAMESALEKRMGGNLHILNPRLGWSHNSNDFTFSIDRIYYEDTEGVKVLADKIYAKHAGRALWEEGVWSALSIFRMQSLNIYADNGTLLRSRPTDAIFALAAREGGGLPYIDDFTISNIRLIEAGITEPSEASYLSLRRIDDALTANVKITLPPHDGRKPILVAAGRIGVGMGGEIAISISDAHTKDLADWGQGLSFLKVVEARSDVSAIVHINKAMRPTIAALEIDLGKGAIHIPDVAPTLPTTLPSTIAGRILPLHKAHLSLELDFATRILHLRRGQASIDKSELDLQGQFTYDQNKGGLSVRGQISDGTAHIDVAEILSAPLQLKNVKADATYDYGNSIFRIDHLSADDEKALPVLTLAAQLTIKPNKKSRLEATIDLAAIDGTKIMDRWSPLLAPKTRKWAMENLSGGRLTGASFKMNVLVNTLLTKPIREPLPERAMHVQLHFEDMQMIYINNMPPLERATGTIDIYGKSMQVSLKSGKVILSNATDPIFIGTSFMNMVDYRDPDRNSTLNLSLKGKSKTIMRYINLPPISATQDFDFDFNRIEGDMSVRVKIATPIKPTLDKKAIRFTAVGESKNASVMGKIDDYILTNGQVQAQVDNQNFSMRGNVDANGVPLVMAWQFAFSAPQESQLAITGEVGKADMVALERGDWADMIENTARINILIAGDVTAPDHYRFNIDLTDADFLPRPLAYKKPAAMAGSLSGRVDLSPQQKWEKLTFLYKDEITTPINGTLVFDGDRLASLTLPPITMGQTRDLTIKFAKNKDYRRLDIKAKYLHINPPFSQEGGVGLSYTDDGFDYLGDKFSIGLTAQTIQSGVELLDDASMTAHHRDGHYEEISSRGRFRNSAALNVNLTRISPDERQLFVQSENAGSFLRLTGLSDSVNGGSLVANNVIIYNGFRDRASNNLRLTGGLSVYNINVRDLPLLARVASLAAISGLPSALRGDGVPFRKGSFNFRLVGDILTVENGLFKGSIGFTTRGDYNVRSRAMDIGGSLIPFYRLNAAFGKVPILGRLVGDNGLVGVSYQITGNARDPDVSVNPLSALALGRLREVIDNSADLPPAGTAPN